MAAPPSTRLQSMLQTAVQSVQWTYSLFWQFHPQQGTLVWGDGYYNGAIKTRKTVQPMEVSAEEASLQRSQELRELYESLSAGGGGSSSESSGGQQVRRPCAALSPEDLTESEWFYLMCVSFSFPPGVGLPGKAYAKRQHVWLTGANQVDSKVFSRAILAKSARVQTVVCIPLLDGVVELGMTERVQEDLAFVQHVKSFFVDHHPLPPKPALSEHSTSNPANSSDDMQFHSPPLPTMYAPVDQHHDNTNQMDEEAEEEEEEDEEEEEEEEGESGSEVEAAGRAQRLPPRMVAATAAEPSELMQLEMSEDIRLGSPDDGSNHLESNFQLHGVGQPAQAGNPVDHQSRVDSFKIEMAHRWPVLQDSLRSNLPPPPPPSAGVPGLEELTQEDTHYSHTISTILNHQSSRRSDSSPSPSELAGYFTHSSRSAFCKWATRPAEHHFHHSSATEGNSQWLLKYVLFTVAFLHTKNRQESCSSKDAGGGGDSSARLRKSASQDELSASHVLAERRRREKLNERFIILRSLVPFVTKMDKASILGDTIEYVTQLRKKIHDLEAKIRQLVSDQLSRSSGDPPRTSLTASSNQTQNLKSGVTSSGSERAVVGCQPPPGSDKRKMRIVEAADGAAVKSKIVVDSPPPPPPPPPPPQPVPGVTVQVQVSIIESDGLVELQCPYREGLLLDVMVTLRQLRVEIVTVQSSLTNGIFVADMRAKVKENANGKKASIMEVKRAINKIIPQH